MPHELLKLLHIVSVVIWIGALLIVPPLLARLSETRGPRPGIASLRTIANAYMTPAMTLVLALGLWMALREDWFRTPWVQGKLIVAVVLSGLHGVVTGQLRRAATNPEYRVSSRLMTGITVVTATLLLAAVTLAVFKPQ